MTLKIGINGFGRIGRMVIRSIIEDNRKDNFLQTFVPKSRLLIHMDADLYSATLFVLTKLDKLFDKDTIISLDEFGYLDKEFLAFHDYTRAYYHDYEIIQHTPKYHRVSIRLKL